jgi:hypothetical protein
MRYQKTVARVGGRHPYYKARNRFSHSSHSKLAAEADERSRMITDGLQRMLQMFKKPETSTSKAV